MNSKLGVLSVVVGCLAAAPMASATLAQTCTTAVPAGTINPDNPINVDTTWSVAGSPYCINGNITFVGGATLTIEPGVVVYFTGNYYLRIGTSTESATIIANGNASNPITFRSNQATPTPGSWQHVSLERNATSNCSLSYCDFIDGGSVDGSLRLIGVSPTLSNLTFANTNNPGLHMSLACAPQISGALSLNSPTASTPVFHAATAAPAPVFSGLNVSTTSALGRGGPALWASFFNSSPTIAQGAALEAVVIGGTLGASSTFGGVSGIDKLRLITADLTISSASAPHPVLTIAPGMTVRLDAGRSILVGGTSSSVRGGLVVDGSATPITFESSPSQNAWNAVRFRLGCLADVSRLEGCVINGGGASGAPVYCDAAAPVLGDLTIGAIGASALAAIEIASASPTLRGDFTFTGTANQYLFRRVSGTVEPTFNAPVCSTSGKLGSGPPNMWANFFNAGPTLIGGPYDIDVVGGTLTRSSTWGAAGLGVIGVTGNLDVGDAVNAPVLSIPAGRTLRFGSNSRIRVGQSQPGGLAIGDVAGSPVVLERANAGQPWAGVSFFQFTNNAASRLHNCVVRGATGLSPEVGSVNLVNASPTLVGVVAETCGGPGIHMSVSASALSDITVDGFGATFAGINWTSSPNASLSGVNTIRGGGRGILVSTGSPSIAGVAFSNLSNYAIESTAVPLFGALVVEASVAKLGKGPPDFWASFFDAVPTLLGSGWVQEVNTGTLTRSTTWGASSSIATIQLGGSLTIASSSSPILTLAAGAQVRLASGASITVGDAVGSLPGSIRALGAIGSPVVFDQLTTKWNQISFATAADSSTSRLQNCELRNCGTSGWALSIVNSSPSIENVAVIAANSGGIRLNGSRTNLLGVSVAGFGATATAIEVNASPDAAISGPSLVQGPGLDGLSLLSSIPVSGLTVESISGVAVKSAVPSLKPVFSAITIGAGVGNVATGGADLWAALLNSNPNIAGSGYAQAVDASTLTTSTTWGPHPAFSEIRLLGGLAVDAHSHPVLTLAPQSASAQPLLVKLATGASITVGSDSQYEGGSLLAVGSSTQHIVFDALVPGARWGTLSFDERGAHVSRLEWVDLLNGRTGANGNVVHCQNSSVPIKDVAIRYAGGGAAVRVDTATTDVVNMEIVGLAVEQCNGGVLVAGDGGVVRISASHFDNILGDAVNVSGNALSLIEDTTFVDCGRVVFASGDTAPVIHDCTLTNWSSVGIEGAIGSLPGVLGSTFNGGAYPLKLPASAVDMLCRPALANTYNLTSGAAIGVFGDTIKTPSCWTNLGCPFDVLGSVTYDAPLTILAGTTIRMAVGTRLDASSVTLPRLVATGTSAAPILITSAAALPARGDWFGMGVGMESLIEHTTVEYAGRAGATDTAGLILNGPSVLRNVLVRQSAGHGVSQIIPTGGMAEPSQVESSSFTLNSGSGLHAGAGARVQLRGCVLDSNDGFGMRTTGATSGSPVTVGLRESSLVGNTSGGVSAVAFSAVNAAYCWWGHSSGPSGSGGGSGASISGAGLTDYNPWFATALGAFRWLEPYVSPLELPPGAGEVEFAALPSDPASWLLEVRDSTSAVVYSATGSGVCSASWDGMDGGAPPAALPDGDYSFELTADLTASPGTLSTLRGTVSLNSTLLIARLTDPSAFAYVVEGSSLGVFGTAAGSQFSSYELALGLGLSPVYGTPTTSSTAVTAAQLGSLTVPTGAHGDLMLRLRTLDGAGLLVATDTRALKLFAIASAAVTPTTFSPNDDAFHDTATLSAGFTWPADWQVEVFQGVVGPLRTWTGSGAQVLFDWDGRDGGGVVLSDGAYTLRISASPVDASTVTTSMDVAVSIDASSSPIRITSPADGDVLTNGVPVSVSLSIPSGISYHTRLEFGPNPVWTLVDESTNANPSPFTTWNTTRSPNGVGTLRASIVLADGSAYAHDVSVTLANLKSSVSDHVFDPLGAETTTITVTNEIAVPGVAPLVVEVHAADTSYDAARWEGRYAGVVAGGPVWSTSLDFSTGAAVVVWNGRDAQYIPVPAGEYVVVASTSYAGGVQAQYLEPVINVPILDNGALSAVSVGVGSNRNFDPYFAEPLPINYSLSRPAWITMGFLQGFGENGMMAKLLHDPGAHVFPWSGHSLNLVGLGAGDASTPPAGVAMPVTIKAMAPPATLMHVRPGSAWIANAHVDPNVFFPALGQVCHLRFQLLRDSIVSAEVFDTTDNENGPHYCDLLVDEPLSAGDHAIQFDGLAGAGGYPRAPGTFTIKLDVRDPVRNSYLYSQRFAVRVLY